MGRGAQGTRKNRVNGARRGPARATILAPREREGERLMKFGFMGWLQLPKPWDADSEYRIWNDGLEQIELSDRIGIDYLWEIEHHFLEEYSHSSAGESFLAACSQRTKRIHLGS